MYIVRFLLYPPPPPHTNTTPTMIILPLYTCVCIYYYVRNITTYLSYFGGVLLFAYVCIILHYCCLKIFPIPHVVCVYIYYVRISQYFYHTLEGCFCLHIYVLSCTTTVWRFCFSTSGHNSSGFVNRGVRRAIIRGNCVFFVFVLFAKYSIVCVRRGGQDQSHDRGGHVMGLNFATTISYIECGVIGGTPSIAGPLSSQQEE